MLEEENASEKASEASFMEEDNDEDGCGDHQSDLDDVDEDEPELEDIIEEK